MFVGLNRPAHTMACTQAVLDPSVPEDQQRQEEQQPFSHLNRLLKVNISPRDIPVALLLVLPRRLRLNLVHNNVVHRTIIAYFPRYRGKYAHTCRLSIAVEHPGDLLLIVTESFSEYYVSGLRKLKKLEVPCAFSGISICCCLPVRELGL